MKAGTMLVYADELLATDTFDDLSKELEARAIAHSGSPVYDLNWTLHFEGTDQCFKLRWINK